MKAIISTLGVVAACAAGCASTPVPAGRVASTEAAVQTAQQAGAERIPDASTHLAMAEGQLGKAKDLIKRGDNTEASALLTRAESDAALAVALSDEAQQKAAAEATLQRVRAMSALVSEPSGPGR